MRNNNLGQLQPAPPVPVPSRDGTATREPMNTLRRKKAEIGAGQIICNSYSYVCLKSVVSDRATREGCKPESPIQFKSLHWKSYLAPKADQLNSKATFPYNFTT